MPTYYDMVLSSPFPNYDFFAHRMRELCGQLNLSFFIADNVWVNDFYQKLCNKEIGVRVLLDLSNSQTNDDDPYLILAREAKRQRAYVIDDPDITSVVAHKALFHQKMLENRILVPETVIVTRNELSSFTVTDEIKQQVGVPFVVKPAWGDSSIGVIIDATSYEDVLMSAEQSPNSDAFLIQRQLKPKRLGDHIGWFRMFHIVSEVIPCWWDPYSHEYHLVTPAQRRYHKLTPLARIMKQIAKVSKMKFFTSEICLDVDGHLYVVDYVNADPDMNPQSYYINGVPDEVVRHIVWLLVNEGMRIIMKRRGYFDEDLSDSDAAEMEYQQVIKRTTPKSKTTE
ncbi:MAG: hypothetical protein JSU58_04170 [Dehalococcoidales bacterium]|nr:MAG: hypothetical protein JSU58_04170 [Dehalococcoidales bacterium]